MNSNQIAQAFLAEFEHELATTRKFLERIPDSKLAWKPHDKSMTAGQLALHTAQVPMGVLMLASKDVGEVPDFSGGREQPKTTQEVLAALDQCTTKVKEILPTMNDQRMMEIFSVTKGGKVVMSMPRAIFLRSIMLNHWYHHRGQLGVYLRLLGEKVPASYGPSADEMPAFAS